MLKIVVLGLLLITSIFLFFWFEYRPVEIRKECYDFMENKKPQTVAGYKLYYEVCLHKKGLE